ncbi:MAG TPA: tyrosine-type recombinase/integrase [Acidimicrobiales bacterium]|nr:tyrosine-type recombinase/integrase [Acidimicrobiales bacterium]
MGRRQFGNVRKLPSGRWQASYWYDGARHVAPDTFHAKADALAWLSTVETDIARAGWVDPRAGRVPLEEYAAEWLDLRTDLRPRTRELYDGLLRRHIVPGLGHHQIGAITPSLVRRWHGELSGETGPGQSTAARCYRLLRTVLNTAVTDELLVKNPCQIKGGGAERSPERPVASIPEVQALAQAISPRLRCFVLLAAFCSLRRGEILALTRADIDLLHRRVTVRRTVVSLRDGKLLAGPPKTAAGRRTVAIPTVIVPDLEAHFAEFVDAASDALLFTGEKGGPLRTHVLQKEWDKARSGLGLNHLHIHDLRHSGNTWAAATGASTAELMARMGHASPAAAIRYQHATADRDQAIAESVSQLALGAANAHRTY